MGGPPDRRDADALRARGYRVTAQRRAVLDAVRALRHGTPDQVRARAHAAGARLDLTTVYRALEVLEEVGLVTHAHLTHGAPTYHARDPEAHLHLVCDACGAVESLPAQDAAPFLAGLRDARGFVADVGHLTVHGACRDCAGAGRG